LTEKGKLISPVLFAASRDVGGSVDEGDGVVRLCGGLATGTRTSVRPFVDVLRIDLRNLREVDLVADVGGNADVSPGN